MQTNSRPHLLLDELPNEGLTLKDELYKMIKENVECFEWFSKEEAKRESHKPIELDNTGKQVHKLLGDAP